MSVGLVEGSSVGVSVGLLVGLFVGVSVGLAQSDFELLLVVPDILIE